MIVYTAITPYLPLIPGKEPEVIFDPTLKAYKKIEEDIYTLNPEIIICIGKQDESIPQNLLAHSFEKATTSFEAFGDFETRQTFDGALAFIQNFKEFAAKKITLSLSSEQKLPFGVSFVLHKIAPRLKKVKVAPFYFSHTSPQDQYEYGKLLKDFCDESPFRIAVVAIGNMSHCLSKESPFIKNGIGKKFDTNIQEYLKNKEVSKILSIDTKTTQKAKECITPQLAMLLGMLDEKEYSVDILSYESPYGIGYLTATLNS